MKSKAEKDLTAVAMAEMLDAAGCKSFYLIVHDEGRISSAGNMEGPVLMQVFDRMKEEFTRASSLAKKLEKGRS